MSKKNKKGRRQARKSDEPKSMKIRYGPGETGWAADLGGGLAELSNLPLVDLNGKDVVRLGPPTTCECCLTVVAVVRRQFSKKTGIRYPKPHKANYKKLWKTFREERDWPFEGWTPGGACLAHPDNANVVEIARAAGVEIEAEECELRAAQT